MRKHLTKTLSNEVAYMTIIALVYYRISIALETEKDFFSPPEDFLIYDLQKLLRLYVLHQWQLGRWCLCYILPTERVVIYQYYLNLLLLAMFLCVSCDAESQLVTKLQ